jgi:adenylate cyclase
MWRGILEGTDPRLRSIRGWLKHVPSNPRCKMCAAPFSGPGVPLMRAMGRTRWSKNPKYCTFCFGVLNSQHGGAEINTSLLFADVRGSVALAEGISPTEYRRQLDRFYETAADLLVRHDAIVDKFVGDQVMAIFIPAIAGELHAERAIKAATALLEATGHRDAGGPWIPLGAGVDSGNAFVGAIGEGGHSELTAVGDVVNVAARLSSAAAAGEVLVTRRAAMAARLAGGLEERHLDLKGKTSQTEVLVLPVRPAEA